MWCSGCECFVVKLFLPILEPLSWPINRPVIIGNGNGNSNVNVAMATAITMAVALVKLVEVQIAWLWH